MNTKLHGTPCCLLCASCFLRFTRLQDRQMREFPWCHRRRPEDCNGRRHPYVARPKSACPCSVTNSSFTHNTALHITPSSCLALSRRFHVLLLGQNQTAEGRLKRKSLTAPVGPALAQNNLNASLNTNTRLHQSDFHEQVLTPATLHASTGLH